MKGLPEKITTAKNEIALIDNTHEEKTTTVISFGEALLKQIAWNIKRIKTMLETEEKSKNIFHLQGMLKGYYLFYRELATIRYRIENDCKDDTEIKQDAIRIIIEGMADAEPEQLVSFDIETDLISSEGLDTDVMLSVLYEDMQYFIQKYKDDLDCAIKQHGERISIGLLSYSAGTRDLYLAQGKSSALSFYSEFSNCVNRSYSAEQAKKKREAEEMALFHQNEEDDAE